MYGDKLYCKRCGQYSNEARTLYDSRRTFKRPPVEMYDETYENLLCGKPLYKSRKKDHYVFRCAYCGSGNLVNVNMAIIYGIKHNILLSIDILSKHFYMFSADWPMITEDYIKAK